MKIMKIVIIGFLFAPYLAFAVDSQKQYPNRTADTQTRFYLEGGVGYYSNLARTKSNKIEIQQITDLPYQPAIYTNDPHSNSLGLYIGGGHQWQLSSSWSWSLGGRISYYDIPQKGNYVFGGVATNYNYDINALLINMVLRLNWHVSLRNTLYGEMAAGIVRLNSKDFRLSASNITLKHYDKIVNNADYNATLGWMYSLSKHTSITVSVGYQDLGKASLGTRVVPISSQSKGNFVQSLYGVDARIGLVHWF